MCLFTHIQSLCRHILSAASKFNEKWIHEGIEMGREIDCENGCNEAMEWILQFNNL